MAVSPPEVVLIGAAILDALAPGADARVFETGSLPCPGLRLQTGGDAMNEAVVLSKLGRRARLVSRLGRDSAGDLILGVCKRHSIDTSFVVRADIDTGVNIVLVSPDGERCFLTNPEGSLRKLEPADVFAAIEAPGFSDVRAVCFASVFAYPLLMPALAEIFRRIKEKGPILLADMTKRKNEETLADVAPALRYADYVFPNLDEAYLLTGSRDPAAIARQFLACGVKNVVIKLGADGCYVKNADLEAYVPAVPGVRAVDSTGAGDNFAAGFIDALLRGEGLVDRARWGNAVASLCVERTGATTGTRDRREVERRARSIAAM